MKLNNKGFAISTVVYGISIMAVLLLALIMASMSSNRSNSRQIVKDVEDDLNRYSRTTVVFKPKTDGTNPVPQVYKVPPKEEGWYYIELLGAGGRGGGGAYTSGLIKLEANQELYFYVGTNGNETDVRVIDGAYVDSESLKGRIMVAGGGGRKDGSLILSQGGTLIGYNYDMVSVSPMFDNLSGTISERYNLKEDSTIIGPFYPDGTISYEKIMRKYTDNKFGVVGKNLGGDGYIPGETEADGGSSYISGYAGCRGYNVNNGNYDSVTTIVKQKKVDDDGNISEEKNVEYFFINGVMLPGANSGSGGESTDGIARIQKVSSSEIKKRGDISTNKNKIIYIYDCYKTTEEGYDPHLEIIYFDGYYHKYVRLDGISTSLVGGEKCVKYNLNSMNINVSQLDEVAVWHTMGRKFYNQNLKLEYEKGGSSEFITLRGKDSTPMQVEADTPNGQRISMYSYDSTKELPDGSYYIQPITLEDSVLTAPATEEVNSDAVTEHDLKGFQNQKWLIEKVEDGDGARPKYKIVEMARYQALKLARDEANFLGFVNVENSYMGFDTQKWYINSLGNGTYTIETAAPTSSNDIGYLLLSGSSRTQVTPTDSSITRTMMIGNKNKTTLRFKFIPTY